MLGNYKIRVNNEAESKEAQELFEKLRYKPFNVKRVGMVAVEKNTIYPDFIENWDKYIGDELTIPQLRDMVAAHRKPQQGLISGADAKLAWAKGEDLLIDTGTGFHDLTDNYYLAVFDRDSNNFKRKPRTITLNVEIPAPFEPKDGDHVWFIDSETNRGYSVDTVGEGCESKWIQFGAWRTEDEIKQVVAALRGAICKK